MKASRYIYSTPKYWAKRVKNSTRDAVTKPKVSEQKTKLTSKTSNKKKIRPISINQATESVNCRDSISRKINMTVIVLQVEKIKEPNGPHHCRYVYKPKQLISNKKKAEENKNTETRLLKP